MSKYIIFIRNVEAEKHVELFLVFAVSAILIIRFYLYLSGFPEIGTGGLHIAHKIIITFFSQLLH